MGIDAALGWSNLDGKRHRFLLKLCLEQGAFNPSAGPVDFRTGASLLIDELKEGCQPRRLPSSRIRRPNRALAHRLPIVADSVTAGRYGRGP